MPISEEAGSLSLRRRFLDGLSLVGGLIAVFQFVVSDNVSSQWFKPTRDWVADRLELSEELAVFSSWWNAVVAQVFPDPPPSDHPLLQNVIFDIGVGIPVCVLLGFLVAAALFVVAILFILPYEEKARTPLEIITGIPFVLLVIGILEFQVRSLLLSHLPEWVKITLVVVLLASFVFAICVMIWKYLRKGE